jgi:hypothetical protein
MFSDFMKHRPLRLVRPRPRLGAPLVDAKRLQQAGESSAEMLHIVTRLSPLFNRFKNLAYCPIGLVRRKIRQMRRCAAPDSNVRE